MDATRRPRPVDPEFDASPPSTVRLRDFDPLDHQRLVVNPFLAALGAVVLGQVARLLASSSFPPATVAMIVPLALLPNLIQYHCLDCGRTGRFSRRRGHACPAVVARWQGGRPRALFPTSWGQLVAWGWLIASAALLLAVLAGG